MTESVAQHPPPLKPGRRRAFIWLTGLLVLVTLELIARAGLLLVGTADWQREQARMATEGLELTDSGEVLHPYAGIALPPTSPGADASDPSAVVNSLGFPHATPPVQQRGQDKFIIAIVGGSVARQLATFGGPALIRGLAESPELSGRQVELVCLAIEGFKQPQQHQIVGYILSLGGEFDAIVNLDGYNELIVAAGNQEVDANTAYPRSWRFHARPSTPPAMTTGALRVQMIRHERQRIAAAARTSLLRYSALRQLVWRIQDLQLQNEQRLAAAQPISAAGRHQRSFQVLGPEETFASDEDRLQQLIELWENSSRQLQHLARGEGFVYVHCLQPSLLLPGMVEWTDDPNVPITPSPPQDRDLLRRGYPRLREAGARLLQNGEHFVDLTGVFENIAGQVFIDACHLNQRGNDILAERIAAEVLAALNTASRAPP